MKNEELLPKGSRVNHTGHGHGTIVDYNGTQKNKYLEDKPEEAIALAAKAGMLGAMVSSFYDGERCPYVVHFDPREKYPQGYKDVYEKESIEVLNEPARDLSRYDGINSATLDPRQAG